MLNPEVQNSGLSCEIDRILPEIVSHDWHVQPDCQRTEIAFRLSGALFSPVRRTHCCESDCPRNLLTVSCVCESRQPTRPTGFPNVFHIRNSPESGGGAELRRATVSVFHFKGPEERFRRTPKRKTAKLRKELLEALTLKVPFETCLTNQGVRIKSRGRDD